MAAIPSPNLEVKWFEYSPNRQVHIDGTYPVVDRETFFINVVVVYGRENSEDQVLLQVIVCSPSGLARMVDHLDPIISGRMFVFMRHYDESAFEDYINRFFTSLNGLPWAKQCEYISRLGDNELDEAYSVDDKPIGPE